MARRGDTSGSRSGSGIESEDLKPIRVVERVLTRPDGTSVRVKVPVYPPFQLKERGPDQPPPRKASADRARRRRRSAS